MANAWVWTSSLRVITNHPIKIKDQLTCQESEMPSPNKTSIFNYFKSGALHENLDKENLHNFTEI